jgi:endonuclease YncB( thermonuclease family)
MTAKATWFSHPLHPRYVKVGTERDTLTVLTASKKQHKICLAEIDAPENAQPFDTKSKQSLSNMCFGKRWK